MFNLETHESSSSEDESEEETSEDGSEDSDTTSPDEDKQVGYIHPLFMNGVI